MLPRAPEKQLVSIIWIRNFLVMSVQQTVLWLEAGLPCEFQHAAITLCYPYINLEALELKQGSCTGFPWVWNLMSCMAAVFWDVLLRILFMIYCKFLYELQSYVLRKLFGNWNHICHSNCIAIWCLMICHYFHLQYDAAILHTTFARLLGPPRASSTVICI